MAGKELVRENYISRLTLIIIQIKSATVNIRMTLNVSRESPENLSHANYTLVYRKLINFCLIFMIYQ